MSLLELTAAAFGLVSVWLTVKEHIACWPTAIVMVMLYSVVFYDAKLYSDVFLQVVYVVMNVYGWAHWARRDRDAKLQVSLMSAFARMAWAVAIAVAAVTVGWIMAHHTDAALPYSDALITCASLAAQWLMARKMLENWLLWIAVDVLALYVYGVKGLWATTGLYGVFLIMSCVGFVTWNRSRRAARVSPA